MPFSASSFYLALSFPLGFFYVSWLGVFSWCFFASLCIFMLLFCPQFWCRDTNKYLFLTPHLDQPTYIVCDFPYDMQFTRMYDISCLINYHKNTIPFSKTSRAHWSPPGLLFSAQGSLISDLKRPGREADYLPLCSDRVNEWSWTCTPIVRLHGACSTTVYSPLSVSVLSVPQIQ